MTLLSYHHVSWAYKAFIDSYLHELLKLTANKRKTYFSVIHQPFAW